MIHCNNQVPSEATIYDWVCTLPEGHEGWHAAFDHHFYWFPKALRFMWNPSRTTILYSPHDSILGDHPKAVPIRTLGEVWDFYESLGLPPTVYNANFVVNCGPIEDGKWYDTIAELG